jgi:protein-L-isoaspartate O-methyltransferase
MISSGIVAQHTFEIGLGTICGTQNALLEVGAGSGYAAAVLGHIASEVYAIERFASVGDGTLGWRDAAPFDAIMVAAGGPVVPKPLKEQRGIGGRLVIAVGDTERYQHLLRITRTRDEEFETEDLGPVMFVPLIGKEGWAENGGRLHEARERSLRS